MNRYIHISSVSSIVVSKTSARQDVPLNETICPEYIIWSPRNNTFLYKVIPGPNGKDLYIITNGKNLHWFRLLNLQTSTHAMTITSPPQLWIDAVTQAHYKKIRSIPF